VASPRIEAARQGQRKYTGKPCKACGGTERYVINAGCVECTKKSKSASESKIREILEQAKAGA
jgi:hypothetical protein